jgi:hypothetical protein
MLAISNFVKNHDRFVTRILEIIPGLGTWIFITSPIWLGLTYPRAVVYITIFITIYWFYLACKGTIGSILGYRKYKSEMSTDWWKKCQELNFAELPDKITLPPSLAETKHFVLVPMVNEPDPVLLPMLESIMAQTYPTEKITLVFTIEEKYSEEMTARVSNLVAPFLSRLEDFMVFVHPAGIVGEAIGAGAANRTWGAKHAVEKLVRNGRNLSDYIFTTIDSDHVLDPQYLSRLTHLYLTSENRQHKYYSTAVYLFNNNLWRVPSIMRIETYFITLGVMGDWALSSGEAEFKDTFSCYSSALQTLVDINYWDVSLGVDDTIFYWRAFIKYNGDFRGMNHFIPFSSDAVEGKNYVNSYKSLYKQLLRWGYGVIDFPLSMKEFLINDNIPFISKLTWGLEHLRKRVLLTNTAFMLTFGFSIASSINPIFRQSAYAYTVPAITSFILTFAMVFLIPSVILRYKMSAPMPKEWPFWRRGIILLEAPLMIVNLLTFSFIPFVDAQTRVMLGKKMKNLYHTPKVR